MRLHNTGLRIFSVSYDIYGVSCSLWTRCLVYDSQCVRLLPREAGVMIRSGPGFEHMTLPVYTRGRQARLTPLRSTRGAFNDEVLIV